MLNPPVELPLDPYPYKTSTSPSGYLKRSHSATGYSSDEDDEGSGSSSLTSSSGESGRFDDAVDEDAAVLADDGDGDGDGNADADGERESLHSAKRRRSNHDHAMKETGKGKGKTKGDGHGRAASGSSRRWKISAPLSRTTTAGTGMGIAAGTGTGITTNAPASTITTNPVPGRASPVPTTNTNRHSLDTPRRSRFVEEGINDPNASVRPPSIFTRKHPPNHHQQQRHSGIFRFGKAIAAAFNPFASGFSFGSSNGSGSGTSKSDASKGLGSSGSAASTSTTVSSSTAAVSSAPGLCPQGQRDREDDMYRAEKAYAELKKAGCKGSIKDFAGGSDGNGHGKVDPDTADQTWNALQERLDHQYQSLARHSRQTSTSSAADEPYKSWAQDPRKSTSSLVLPKRTDSLTRASEDSDSERPEIRKQRSRRELQREAKLVKKVGSLEEKLDRARRELRVLTGDGEGEHEMSSRPVQFERPYPRRFVPGALPTLPSERLLDRAGAGLGMSPESTPEVPMDLIQNVERCRDEVHETDEKRVSTPKSPNSQSKQSTDSPSRKRKSPDEASKTTPKPSTTTERTSASASPSQASTNTNTGTPRSGSRRAKLQKTGKGDSPLSVERKQSQNASQLKKTDDVQVLQQQQHQAQSQPPRSPPPPVPRNARAQHQRQRMTSRFRSRTPPSAALRRRKSQTDLRSVIPSDYYVSPCSAAPASGDAGGDEEYEYIPPVPPIPKDLVAAAAKVDQRLARELRMRRSGHANATATADVGGDAGGYQPPVKEEFTWPDDIF